MVEVVQVQYICQIFFVGCHKGRFEDDRLRKSVAMSALRETVSSSTCG